MLDFFISSIIGSIIGIIIIIVEAFFIGTLVYGMRIECKTQEEIKKRNYALFIGMLPAILFVIYFIIKMIGWR